MTRKTHQTVDLGAAKFVVGTRIEPNVIAGTFVLTQEMTTGTVLETYGVTGICPTKPPAEVRPARIAEDPVLSTEDAALLTSARGYIPSPNRYTTTEPIDSEDAGEGDYLTAHVGADLGGDMEKE